MIEASAYSDKGLVRKTNQDYFALSQSPPDFFVLCDGMGGHDGGDIASRSAAESIKKYISINHSLDNDREKAEKLLKEAVSYANKIVYKRAQVMPGYRGMGTTCDICFLDFDMLYTCHVGDSRIYLYRDNNLTQLTKDHTLIEELLKNGNITQKEIENHPGKHMITRAVGTEEYIESDFGAHNLKSGDVILMCSDGLTNMLSDTAIKKILLPGGELPAMAKRLVEKANENGGLDNITVIVLRYTDNKEERA